MHSRDHGIQVGRDPRVPLVLPCIRPSATLVLGTALVSAGLPTGFPEGTPCLTNSLGIDDTEKRLIRNTDSLSDF